MDYRKVDAIWNKIVNKIVKLEVVEEFTEKEERIIEVYRESVERGRIEWEKMAQLNEEVDEALKLRNL